MSQHWIALVQYVCYLTTLLCLLFILVNRTRTDKLMLKQMELQRELIVSLAVVVIQNKPETQLGARLGLVTNCFFCNAVLQGDATPHDKDCPVRKLIEKFDSKQVVNKMVN